MKTTKQRLVSGGVAVALALTLLTACNKKGDAISTAAQADKKAGIAAPGIAETKAIAEAGYSFQITLPNRRFHRRTGICAGMHFDPQGNPLTKEEWEAKKHAWLPSEADEAYLQSLMAEPVYEANQMANWLQPPPHGIKGKPVEFEYVRRHP